MRMFSVAPTLGNSSVIRRPASHRPSPDVPVARARTSRRGPRAPTGACRSGANRSRRRRAATPAPRRTGRAADRARRSTRGSARRGDTAPRDGARPAIRNAWSVRRRVPHSTPIASSSSTIVATSAMRGTFVSTCSPGASNVAAMSLQYRVLRSDDRHFAGERPVAAAPGLDPCRQYARPSSAGPCQRPPCSGAPKPVARIVNRFAEPPASLLEPRDDVVHEVPQEDGSFAADGGPFTATTASSTRTVGLTVETIELLARRAVLRIPLRAPSPGARCAAMTPTACRGGRRLNGSTAARQHSGCSARSRSIVGYLNTLLTQTIAFAADEFGSSDRAQGVSLARSCGAASCSRCHRGLADRQGRRRLILGLAIAARSSPPRARWRLRSHGSRCRRRSPARSRWRSGSSWPS